MRNAVVKLIPILLVAGAGSALAKGKPPELATYNDAQAKVTFQYPKTWRVITIADDGSKAEAKNESGRSRLTVEAVAAPPDANLKALLKGRLPNGRDSSVGEWQCVEAEVDDGTRYAAFCGKKVKGAGDEVLIIGVSSSQKDFEAANRREFICKKLGGSVKGFRAGE